MSESTETKQVHAKISLKSQQYTLIITKLVQRFKSSKIGDKKYCKPNALSVGLDLTCKSMATKNACLSRLS